MTNRVNPDSKWFANEAFWEWSFPFMFPAQRFEQATQEVQQLMQLSGVDGGAMLDLACGPGRHSVALARRGFDVTGVDRSAFLLNHARHYAEAEGVSVEWLEEDMRAFRRVDTYNLAISIFTSFGYFESAEENQQVLENVRACLKPSGKCVIHVLGKEPLAHKFVATEVKELDDDGLLIQHRRIIEDWSRLRADWIVVRASLAERFSFCVWIYSGSELRQMLLDAGFGSVELYGSLEGSPYDLYASRLVAVATKS